MVENVTHLDVHIVLEREHVGESVDRLPLLVEWATVRPISEKLAQRCERQKRGVSLLRLDLCNG
jgi:hypothetical protein